MPCYQLLCFARPETSPKALAETFRRLARLVYREKGQMRTVENLGVRPLAYAHRIPREKFDDARLIQCSYDLPPSALVEVEGLLRNDPNMLRYFHLRDASDSAGFKPGASKSASKKRKPLSAEMLAKGNIFNDVTMKVDAERL